MPSKQWDEEDSDASSTPSSPPASATATATVTATRRRQFDDEEDDSDVLDSWDAAEDSEAEREKEKKAAVAKEKAAAEAAQKKKSKSERIAEHQAARAQALLDDDESEEEETEAERRERLRRTEKESDLHHAEAMFGDFGDIGISNNRKAKGSGAVITLDEKDPSSTVNIGSLPLFNPTTKLQFENLRNTLVPIITANSKKPHYALFLQEFAKQLAAELPSDQVKKVSSALTTLSNEKMKAEKASDKGGKKTKAAKTKTSLVANRTSTVDTNTYEDDAFGDDDFM